MKKVSFYKFGLWIVGLSMIISCGKNEKPKSETNELKKDPKVIEVEAENFTGKSSETLEVKPLDSGLQYVSANAEGWIALDVNILVAGRYKSEIIAASDAPVNCWIEDYTDNKDERTYNITGNMVASAKEFSSVSKDGSPLNVGLHKMKIHFDGSIDIDQVKFTLIKEHDVTPQMLTQNMDGKEWKVVWADEFDGTELDTTKWTYDIGDWGWGNNELQYYTKNRKENTRIEDGNLIIEARKNDMDAEWTSARLTTRGKTSFLYGKIEFKAKVPTHRGNWAAGWTLGDDYVDELSWPYCGEIDIMESVGYEMDDETGNGVAHASAHSRAYYFKLGNQPTSIMDVKKMHEEFHTYTLIWSPDEIKMLVDDIAYFTYNDTKTEFAWPFAKAHNIILNLAMGGGWGGAQGMDENITSQKMIIDYVRVYELQ